MPEPSSPSSPAAPSGFSLPHVAGLVRAAIPPMHPGGRPIVAGVALTAAVLHALTGRGAVAGALATAATAAFFREPRRVPPPRAGVVLAAADGTVAVVSEGPPPPELGLPPDPVPRVSVFLSVLDVHVQRIPVDGRVRGRRVPARHLPLRRSGQGQRGQRTLRAAAGDGGRDRVGVVQIAGLLARRIVCDVHPGNEVAAGETYGLIRFGSRVDTYLPPGSRVAVAVGQRTIGGETVLAELPGGS